MDLDLFTPVVSFERFLSLQLFLGSLAGCPKVVEFAHSLTNIMQHQLH